MAASSGRLARWSPRWLAVLACVTRCDCLVPHSCGLRHRDIHIFDVSFVPDVPRTAEQVVVQARGRCHSDEVLVKNVTVRTSVFSCQRIDSCMLVASFEEPFCNLFEGSCKNLRRDDEFSLIASGFIPYWVFRSDYHIHSQIVSVHGDEEQEFACYDLKPVFVMAGHWTDTMHDYTAAVVAFLVAASSSRALGKLFPRWSQGILPQITGYLAIGVIVGPYMTNLITSFHIFLIGRVINQLSLAFIAGAAGSEIFFPELRSLIVPMCLQVFLVVVMTLFIVTTGLLCVVSYTSMPLLMLIQQRSTAARVLVAFLVATLMTARSPASAIGVIAELKANGTSAAKLVIGVTVLSDIVVLVLFALVTSLVHVTTDGRQFTSANILSILGHMGASLLFGVLAGLAMKWCLPGDVDQNGSQDEEASSTWRVGSRGALLLAILYTTFLISDEVRRRSEGAVKMQPLFVCIVASCLCGHDSSVRNHLVEALHFWTPAIILPFFTLAGASLNLASLWEVLPSVVVCVLLRMAGVAIGSFVAGKLSGRLFPEIHMTQTSVRCTWMTLLAQAGVTLGLVLEVQKDFRNWGISFATMVIGVVVLNQLLGPVLCRIGLGMMIEAEVAEFGVVSSGDKGSECSSVEEMSDDQSEGHKRAIVRSTKLGKMYKHLEHTTNSNVVGDGSAESQWTARIAFIGDRQHR
mmetsp:Transcript_33670/g.89920  ORF Transcript_33670/g.89920 Transcript_33670/m.89920 type:complete len:690 (-) Transcript_33670:101-2170(-)